MNAEIPETGLEINSLASSFDSTQFCISLIKTSFTSQIATSHFTNPNHVSVELGFYKELFSKLKFNYLEQVSKEKFTKRILNVPADFEMQNDLEILMREQKDSLKAKKHAIDLLKKELMELVEKVSLDLEETQNEKVKAVIVSKEIEKLEQEHDLLESWCNPSTASLNELKNVKNDKEAKILELKARLEEVKAEYRIKQSKNSLVEQEILNLTPKRVEAESFASDAMRISKLKDPQIEELGRWYLEMNAFLYKWNDILSIKNISATEFEIDYSEYTLHIVLNAGSKQGAVIEAWLPTTPKCQIQDIVSWAISQSLQLDESLSILISLVKPRVQSFIKRLEEMDSLSSHVSYDIDANQVMVHNNETGRVFIIQLGHNYPMSPIMQILGIEPLSGSDDLAHHQALLDTHSLLTHAMTTFN